MFKSSMRFVLLALGVALVAPCQSFAADSAVTNLLASVERAINAGDLVQAEALVRKAEAGGIDRRLLVRSRAGIMLKRGKAEQARSLLSMHLRDEPADLEARALLCVALVELKDGVELREQVKQMALQSRKSSFLTLVSQGQLMILEGDWQRARSSFMQAAQLWPAGSGQVMQYVLQADVALGDEFAAREHAEAILERNPRDAFAIYVLGSLAIERGEYELGVRQLDKSVALSQSIAAMNDLAWGLYKLGRLDEAERMANKVLTKNPEMHATLDTLGMIALERGKLDEAEGLFTKALRIEHRDLSVFLHLAQVRLAKGNKTGAAEIVKELAGKNAELKPEDRAVMKKMAGELGISIPAGE